MEPGIGRRASKGHTDMVIPTVRPIVDWRTEDERMNGVPLWTGKDEITVSDIVKRDIVAEAQNPMAALREAVADLRDERAKCEARIAEIDELLASMGTVAAPPKPKRGRPRKAKAEATGA